MLIDITRRNGRQDPGVAGRHACVHPATHSVTLLPRQFFSRFWSLYTKKPYATGYRPPRVRVSTVFILSFGRPVDFPVRFSISRVDAWAMARALPPSVVGM